MDGRSSGRWTTLNPDEADMAPSKPMNTSEGYTYPPPSIAGGRVVRSCQAETQSPQPKLTQETLKNIEKAAQQQAG